MSEYRTDLLVSTWTTPLDNFLSVLMYDYSIRLIFLNEYLFEFLEPVLLECLETLLLPQSLLPHVCCPLFRLLDPLLLLATS
jgi:hypothetical protein